MCNLPLPPRSRTAAPLEVVRSACSAIALAHLPLPAPPLHGERRRWTSAELTEILEALTTLRTSDIARSLGVNPKALRSLLRRNGVSLRALRDYAKRDEPSEGGLVVRRSTIGPSATYGAAALENLPDDACRWSFGDPAEPGFAFCGAPAEGRSAYCSTHHAQAFQNEVTHEKDSRI